MCEMQGLMLSYTLLEPNVNYRCKLPMYQLILKNTKLKTCLTNQSFYPNARGEKTIAAEGALMSLRCRKKTNVSAMSQEDYSIIVITDTAYANLCRKP